MNTGPTLVADIETTEPMQPRQRPFDDPAGAAQPAAVGRAAFGELALNAPARERVAMRLRIVRAVALNQSRRADWASRAPAQRRNGVDQREQLGDVVAVGAGQRRDERNPVRVGENVMFGAGLAAIGRVRSSFFPPRNARSEALSTTARARSRSPRCRSSASRTACKRFQTPARCQRTSRRQQVVPEPHPISRGSMFQGMPLRKMKKMPVNTARSGIGLRPAYRRLRARRFGSKGSIRLHKSSSMSGLVMHNCLPLSYAKVPSSGSKYKRVGG